MLRRRYRSSRARKNCAPMSLSLLSGANPSRRHLPPSLPLVSPPLEATAGTTRERGLGRWWWGPPPPSHRVDLGRHGRRIADGARRRWGPVAARSDRWRVGAGRHFPPIAGGRRLHGAEGVLIGEAPCGSGVTPLLRACLLHGPARVPTQGGALSVLCKRRPPAASVGCMGSLASSSVGCGLSKS
jgi:hypothetical protein